MMKFENLVSLLKASLIVRDACTIYKNMESWEELVEVAKDFLEREGIDYLIEEYTSRVVIIKKDSE